MTSYERIQILKTKMKWKINFPINFPQEKKKINFHDMKILINQDESFATFVNNCWSFKRENRKKKKKKTQQGILAIFCICSLFLFIFLFSHIFSNFYEKDILNIQMPFKLIFHKIKVSKILYGESR